MQIKHVLAHRKSWIIVLLYPNLVTQNVSAKIHLRIISIALAAATKPKLLVTITDEP